MKQCTYCGKECPDEAFVCAIDGEPLRDIFPPPPVAPASPVATAQDNVRGKLSITERIVHVLLSIFLIGYGVHGLLANDLFLPSKHGRGTHLHGTAMVLMLICMACATIVLMSTVIEYYDRRDNDRSYKLFARLVGYCGGTFFILSLIDSIYQKYSR